VKKLLQRWFAPRAKLDARQAARLAAWDKAPAPDTKLPFGQARYVVVDVETTGLNLMMDTLISIGAVAVVNGRVVMADSFSVVLQQQQSSRKENILIHGISGSVQREGVPPADALLDFLQFVGDSPLVAFHVAFDETMIRRAMRQYLNHNFKHPWLDLAYVMPALNRDLMRSHRVLDDWIGRFGIRIAVRHNALADALATAQLLQIAQSQARRKDVADYAGLRDLERAQRWVSNVR
jgi:DNA polymerase-3 subunit epsilon